MEPTYDPTPDQPNADSAPDTSTSEELQEITQQAEREATTPEVISKGDAFLEDQRGAAETMLHHLIHLPERRTEYGGNTADRVTNAALKTAGVIMAAFAVKIGISSAQVPIMAEAVVAGTGLSFLATSILQGMLANSETSMLREEAQRFDQPKGEI